jgi:pyruvate kinase
VSRQPVTAAPRSTMQKSSASQDWIRTKIVCTIGPITQDCESLKKLYDAGMRCARMNFSHGSHEYHAQTIANVRQALGPKDVCAIMLDTKGPEIRTGKLQEKEVKLEQGKSVTLKYFPDDPQGMTNKGCSEWITQDYANLSKVLSVGKEVCIDDGLLSLTVTAINGTDVVCTINNTVMLGETKGVNLPGTAVDLPAITEKDKSDLIFGVQQGVDLIAASFVRKAQDVLDIRAVLGHPGRDIMIFSKIESEEGVDNFDEILAVSDGIMVARGDLGIEIPIQKVYTVQKMIIEKCNRVGKPVITATQMLESMVVNPRPTRAEVTDVANAVTQGTDCVMLSGETAKGKWPVECVQMMAEICRTAEAALDYNQEYQRLSAPSTDSSKANKVQDAVSGAVVKTAMDIDAALLMCLTNTGATARAVAKFKPQQRCIAITPSDSTARKLCLSRGVYPRVIGSMIGSDQVLSHNCSKLISEGVLKEGQTVVCSHGDSHSSPGSTSVLKVIVAKSTAGDHNN